MRMFVWLVHVITRNQTRVTLKLFDTNRKAEVGRLKLRCLGNVKSDLRETRPGVRSVKDVKC